MRGSFPSRRGSSTCQWNAVGGKMSHKNLEHRITIKFCVKIGRSASETLAYGEYARKKSSVFNGLGGSRKTEKMCSQFKTMLVCFFDHNGD
jgi:hypothetical protein